MTSPKESIMSYFPGMQKGNLDSIKPDVHGKIKKETVSLQGVSVTRVTFDVGAKWSNDLKEYAGTHSCQLPHVALVLSGTLRVVMDAGSRQDFSKNDVMLLPVWTAATPQHRPLLGHFFDVNRDE